MKLATHFKSTDSNIEVFSKACGGTAQTTNVYGVVTWSSSCNANYHFRIKSWNPQTRALTVECYIHAWHSANSYASNVYFEVPTTHLYGYTSSNAAVMCVSITARSQQITLPGNTWNVVSSLGTTTVTVPSTVDLKKTFYITTGSAVAVRLNGIDAHRTNGLNSGPIFTLQPPGFTASKVRVAGAAKSIVNSYVRVSGATKPVVGVWSRQGGVLKQC